MAAVVAATPALAVGAAPAGPAAAQPAEAVEIVVIEVSGLLDPIQVDFLADALRDAERDGVGALVVRLDSAGSVVPAADVTRLARAIRASEVPVAAWVGPGRGAEVQEGAYRLFRAAAVRGMAPGSEAGPFGARQALRREVAEVDAATLGHFILGISGRSTRTGEIDVPTTVVRRDGRPPQVQLAPVVRVSFAEPSFVAQILHAVATPSAAYLLLVVGLLLILFEFFTAGVGVAGVTGAASLVLAGYGLGVLPTRPLALAAVGLGVVGCGIDVQAGTPRTWTVIGTLSFVAGTFFLFAGMSVPLVLAALMLVGFALFMVSAMPAMVRARFSTPTIGRESMLGEEGTAVSDIAPDGVVRVRDAPWPARTNRATPIKAGDAVKVGGIDGLVLEVEPLEGAARDAGH